MYVLYAILYRWRLSTAKMPVTRSINSLKLNPLNLDLIGNSAMCRLHAYVQFCDYLPFFFLEKGAFLAKHCDRIVSRIKSRIKDETRWTFWILSRLNRNIVTFKREKIICTYKYTQTRACISLECQSDKMKHFQIVERGSSNLKIFNNSK